MSKHSPLVITTVEALAAWRNSVDRAKIGFVPTMGALHRGHGQLLKELRPQCDISVLSIFVNPTQFAPHEDLDRYPKSFASDCELATSEGVDVIFAPPVSELYLKGFTTYVEEIQLSLPFCGPLRPGHFRGVTTIVLKLFNLIRPQLALFGLKDAQQFFVLKKMVQDLNIPVIMRGVPTVRETDGLALSSRNIYLTPEERCIAPLIYQSLLSLRKIAETFLSATRESFNQSQISDQSFDSLFEALQTEQQKLTARGFRVQYLEARKLPDFELLNPTPPAALIIAIAAMLGNTRLIDNVLIGEF